MANKSTKEQTSNDTDLNIIKSNSNHCFNEDNGKINITKCDHLQRMLLALNYYQKLRMHNDNSSTKTNEIFISFCDKSYGELLNDYEHIITKHEEHLEEINAQILKDNKHGHCDLFECNPSRRYNDNSIRDSSHHTQLQHESHTLNAMDPRVIFYQEIFDFQISVSQNTMYISTGT